MFLTHTKPKATVNEIMDEINNILKVLLCFFIILFITSGGDFSEIGNGRVIPIVSGGEPSYFGMENGEFVYYKYEVNETNDAVVPKGG